MVRNVTWGRLNNNNGGRKRREGSMGNMVCGGSKKRAFRLPTPFHPDQEKTDSSSFKPRNNIRKTSIPGFQGIVQSKEQLLLGGSFETIEGLGGQKIQPPLQRKKRLEAASRENRDPTRWGGTGG